MRYPQNDGPHQNTLQGDDEVSIAQSRRYLALGEHLERTEFSGPDHRRILYHAASINRHCEEPKATRLSINHAFSVVSGLSRSARNDECDVSGGPQLAHRNHIQCIGLVRHKGVTAERRKSNL